MTFAQATNEALEYCTRPYMHPFCLVSTETLAFPTWIGPIGALLHTGTPARYAASGAPTCCYSRTYYVVSVRGTDDHLILSDLAI